jgi:hypothetical protein
MLLPAGVFLPEPFGCVASWLRCAGTCHVAYQLCGWAVFQLGGDYGVGAMNMGGSEVQPLAAVQMLC